MGIYGHHILPHVIDLAMRQRPVMRQRGKVVPMAEGRVLEVGIGSGLNLAFYDPQRVEKVWGLDPSAELRQRALQRADKTTIPVEFIGLAGEEIPMDSATFDTVVMTYTLCSITQRRQALEQMRRVLKPGGKLLFCEHGRAPDAAVARWQARLNPLWSRLGGGCHLDVAVPDELEQSGFLLQDLQTLYLPGPRPLNFNYWGAATTR